MSNQLRATVYLRSGISEPLFHRWMASSRKQGFRLILESASSPRTLNRLEPNKSIVLVKPFHTDGPALLITTAFDLRRRSSAFLDLLADLFPQMDIESVLLEMGPDLEPQPGCTRDELARFDFKSHAGIGLRTAPASWLRACLAANGGQAFETQIGAITLFISAPLCQAFGIEISERNLATELFIPWFRADKDDVLACWLKTLPWNDTEIGIAENLTHLWTFPAHDLQPETQVSILQTALAPYEFLPTQLPVSLPLYALPLLAYPDKVPGGFRRNRPSQVYAAVQTFTGLCYDTIPTPAIQSLEILVLNSIRFIHKDAPCELLFRRADYEIELFIAKPGLASHSPADEWELDITTTISKVIKAGLDNKR